MADFVEVRPSIVVVVHVGVVAFTVAVAVLEFSEVGREGVVFVRHPVVVKVAWAGEVGQDVHVVRVAVVVRIEQERVGVGARLVVAQSIAVFVGKLGRVVGEQVGVSSVRVVAVAIAVSVRPLGGVGREGVGVVTVGVVAVPVAITVFVLGRVVGERIGVGAVGVVAVVLVAVVGVRVVYEK